MSGIPSPIHPAALPVQLTSFIGREAEIALVTEWLRRPEVRLLTLTGPGGIGKTRLAIRAGERFRDRFADGAAFISLAPVREPELVVPTVAQALGIADDPGQPALARLRTFLEAKQLLLVLDNLEHVLDVAANLVTDLLTHCPRLTALCTSRVRLEISGEHAFPLDALPPDSARALFAVRAGAASATFVITDELAPVVDAICERVDRLPLAIELAAARIGVLPLRALLARLDQSLDLLRGGPRDAPPRQRDLRQAIAWSHDLLTASEQALFRRLGIFVGGFTLEAARAVMGGNIDALDGVSALVTASLVKPIGGAGDEPRFTMLETIQEYALERLAASEDELSIRQSHARYIVTLAEAVWELPDGPVTEAGMRRMLPEIGNIRLALGWSLHHEPDTALQLAGALADHWVMYGSYTEGRDWVERALQAAPQAPSRYRARALLTAGWLAMDQGDLDFADACLAEAVTRARKAPDEKLLTMSLGIHGLVALKGNALERARRLFEEERTSAVGGNPLHRAIATAHLGQVAMARGDLAVAQDLFEEALATHQAGSGPTGVAFGHLYLGQVNLARGNHASAAAFFQEAWTRFANSGGLGGIVRAVEGLAGAVVTSQPDQAARLLGAAATMRIQDEWPRDLFEVPAWEQTVITARTTLGEPAFDAAWNAGKQLSGAGMLAGIDALVDTIETHSPPRSSPLVRPHGLTPRELDVLRLLVEGRSNRAIADTLSLSDRTVENHVTHILTKLGLESRTAAATYALRHGLA